MPIWNGMVASVPALVVQPISAGDVAAAVASPGSNGLLVSVKGGGHNVAGTAIAEGGLMLDMSRMRELTVDSEAKLAHVGPGCRLQDVDRATQAHGLATVLGFVSEVGVAGLTLGGGLGYLTRRFGWTVDNLQEVEIVTADGQIRTASREENADLFWALRGGGGNFGVVTRFTFRLHEVGPTVFGGLIAWPFERADEILREYRAITSESPRELAVLARPPPRSAGPLRARGMAREEALCDARLLQRRSGRDRPGARSDPLSPRPRRRPSRGAAVHPAAVPSRRDRAQGHALLLEDGLPRRAERRLPVGATGALRHLPDATRRPRRPAARRGARGARRGRRGRRQPGRALRLRREGHVGARRARTPTASGSGSGTRGSGSGPSPRAGRTSTSSPPTKARSASARATATTTTDSSTSSGGTTRRTCSGRIETSALADAGTRSEAAVRGPLRTLVAAAASTGRCRASAARRSPSGASGWCRERTAA